METSNLVNSNFELPNAVADCDDWSTSADYRTVSAGSNKSATDYKSISNDDYRDDQHTSLSDYSTLPPDLDNEPTDTPVNTHSSSDYHCKLCVKCFRTLPACLRHELVDHNNTISKTPHKAVRLALKTYSAALEQSNDEQSNRQHIHQILQNCERGLELHELLKIYCISDEKTRDIGQRVRDSLENELKPIRNLTIFNFGSIMNGLMTRDSDVDVYITTRSFQNERGNQTNQQPLQKDRILFNRINALLRRSGKFEEIVTIRNARVPIIKCRHPATGMRVDINCSCPNSVVNSQFLNNLLRFDVRLRSLMRFLKIWAKQMKLIGRGNMTSYCLTTLVLFYWQQPFGERPAIVPSIKQLQMHVPAKYVEGINYAYDIYRCMRPLPLDLTVQDLLKNFFTFYRNFDFSKNMVAPYLGEIISIMNLKSGNFQFYDYERQLRTMREYAGDRYDVEDLNINKCLVVQDPFQLNQNIARGVAGTHLEYFRKCVEYAYHICMNPEIKSTAELYERLLFDIISQIGADARALRESVGQPMPLDSSHELVFSFMPSRVELRALAHYQLNYQCNNTTNNVTDAANAANANSNLYREWTYHYVEAIYAILAFVYRMRVRLVSKTEEVTDNELDDETPHTQLMQTFWQVFQEKGELIWHVSSKVDLWNGRTYNRQNAISFMDYQIKQTEKLLSERTNVAAYSVDVSGLLTVKPTDGYKSLALTITQHQENHTYLTKKDPLRKFFTSFKNSMQNFNLKEKLQTESGRKQMPQSQDLAIWKKREFTAATTGTATALDN